MATNRVKTTKTFRQRQSEELEVIKLLFGNDIEDLSETIDSGWKPLDIRILLTARCSGDSSMFDSNNRHFMKNDAAIDPLNILLLKLRPDLDDIEKAKLSTKLHIICSAKYPKVVPTIKLEETKGLSTSLTDELLKLLQQQSVELRGNAMICDLAKTVEEFLFKNKKTSVPNNVNISQSRLKTEFEELDHLGKGAFGDVLQVRNILDHHVYAIKRIPLPAKRPELYKKMTREVKLLSRLNHDNVVRYFTSWIERATDEDMAEINKLVADDWSVTDESTTPITPSTDEIETSSSIRKGFSLPGDSSQSDGIQFIYSNGETATYEEEAADETGSGTDLPQPTAQVMYIQMEFCENCTLRTVIDNLCLYENPSLVWRLFREIIEGLSHIHQQGIIHRDMKPANIFLDSRNRIKIGDFGLATTIPSLPFQLFNHLILSNENLSNEKLGTGNVGTALYAAPELTADTSHSTYGQSVDMYSLGIILFEMSQPSFQTEMERTKTILLLRTPAISMPEQMVKAAKYEKNVKVIRWLLDHDRLKRPTPKELLASDLIPLAEMRTNEHMLDMLRHTLANKQHKPHEHLSYSCLRQTSTNGLKYKFFADFVSQNSALEFVKSKVVNLFRKHGAIEVLTPLILPFSKRIDPWLNHPVKLMTYSGEIVVLPSDQRSIFACYVAINSINILRRYSVDRVYRKEESITFNRKDNFECAFDIITPKRGNLLIDAEILSVAYEITNDIPRLREKNISIRINHTGLLRSILIYSKFPKTMYANLFSMLLRQMEYGISAFELHLFIKSIANNIPSALIKLLVTDFVIDSSKNIEDDPILKNIVHGKGYCTGLARKAIQELKDIVQLANSLGVTCPIYVRAGLPIGFERNSHGGIVWQMLAKLNPKSSRQSVLAVGERYDSMLSSLSEEVSYHNKNRIGGAGFSLSLENLVTAMGSECDEEYRAIDVAVCVPKNNSCDRNDVMNIMRDLLSAGIRSGIIEAAGAGEADKLAKKLGAAHVIMMTETLLTRVRSWNRRSLQERYVFPSDLVKYIQKLLSNDNTLLDNATHSMPKVKLIFLIDNDKLTDDNRQTYGVQIIRQMRRTLLRFENNEHFTIIVVELPTKTLNAIVGVINPREFIETDAEQELNIIIKRFPEHQQNISRTFKEIADVLSKKNDTPIVALYSITDTYYRVII